MKLLKGLNPSKALGPDELHPRVLKELATELGLVFAHLFQQSIDNGEIPKEWSLANICPLFKKSDSTCVQLSPGFLDLCTLQVTRTHSYVQISWLILMNINSSDRQHAFRKGHSCETQLTTVINDQAKILDNRGHSYWILKRHLIHPLMNSLKTNCLAMELVARY